jgi:hypothetical protein
MSRLSLPKTIEDSCGARIVARDGTAFHSAKAFIAQHLAALRREPAVSVLESVYID